MKTKAKLIKTELMFGKVLLLITLGFFIAENMIFGWNKTPMSEAEKVCDEIVKGGLIAGIFFYGGAILAHIESQIKKGEQ